MPGPNAPYTQLDSTQVLRQAFNETTDRLRVDASVTATIGDVVINADESDIAIKDRVTGYYLHINSDGSIDANVVVSASGGDSILISDGIDVLAINADGSINVSGVSTEAKQDIGNASLASIDSKVLTDAQLRASPVPVSVSSLPLPLGAATEAKQDVGNTSLSSIDSKLNTLGQKTSAGSVPVVLSSDQSSIPSLEIGTVDGTAGGTQRVFVNNTKSQVLSSHDLVNTYTWLDFGTKNERVNTIVYTSATITGVTVTRSFSYTNVSGKYRLDTEIWTTTPGG